MKPLLTNDLERLKGNLAALRQSPARAIAAFVLVFSLYITGVVRAEEMLPHLVFWDCGIYPVYQMKPRTWAEELYHYEPIMPESLTLTSNATVVTLKSPNVVSVTSEYDFNTTQTGIKLPLIYCLAYGSTYTWDGKPIYATSPFTDFTWYFDNVGLPVAFGAHPIDRYIIDAPEWQGHGRMMVIEAPAELDLKEPGSHKLKMDYTFEIPGGFEKYRKAAGAGGEYYFRFGGMDINPLVNDQTETSYILRLDGVPLTDFGALYPTDLAFTEDGCIWRWGKGEQPAMPFVIGGRLDRGVVLDYSGWIPGEGTLSQVAPGFEVPLYEKPYTTSTSPPIKTLKAGELLYICTDLNVGWQGIDIDRAGGVWFRVRTTNNDVGYVFVECDTTSRVPWPLNVIPSTLPAGWGRKIEKVDENNIKPE